MNSAGTGFSGFSVCGGRAAAQPVIFLSEGLIIRCETEQKTKGMWTERRKSNCEIRNSTAPPAASCVHCPQGSSLCITHFHSVHATKECSRG